MVIIELISLAETNTNRKFRTAPSNSNISVVLFAPLDQEPWRAVRRITWRAHEALDATLARVLCRRVIPRRSVRAVERDRLSVQKSPHGSALDWCHGPRTLVVLRADLFAEFPPQGASAAVEAVRVPIPALCRWSAHLTTAHGGCVSTQRDRSQRYVIAKYSNSSPVTQDHPSQMCD